MAFISKFFTAGNGNSITMWTRRGGGGSVESPQLVMWQRVDNTQPPEISENTFVGLSFPSTSTWTKFYPILTPNPLKWTKIDISHTFYPLPHNHLVHVVIE